MAHRMLNSTRNLAMGNDSLPPIGDGPRKTICVKVDVPADWESRLDMQWVIEREIHADRWSWTWDSTYGPSMPSEPTMGMWDDFCDVFKVPFDKFEQAYKAMRAGYERDRLDATKGKE